MGLFFSMIFEYTYVGATAVFGPEPFRQLHLGMASVVAMDETAYKSDHNG